MTTVSIAGVLPLNVFIRKCNNFCLFFIDNFIGTFYQKTEVYKKCLVEHKEKMESIIKRLHAHKNVHSIEYKTILYEAYVIMRPYVQSDHELFK